MIRILLLVVSFFSFALTAGAHVGSPDIFYDGMVGPYPARVTIRMPTVVPAPRSACAFRRVNPAGVSFLPVYARTAVTNAPPPDIGRLIAGETNLYSGELWLMSSGAYSVEVRIEGAKGKGMAQIPVTSVAIRQLPMPSLLGKVLLLLAAVLVLGGIGIAAAAFREADLPAGAVPGKPARRSGWFAGAITAVIFGAALIGGKYWWNAEEGAFRRQLFEGAWPDLLADVRTSGGERILRLEVGRTFFQRSDKLSLIPDHGKMMHLFLVREGSRDAFAHLHPVRKGGNTFEVTVPPLPEGRYAIFCDLTFEGGVCSTATNSVSLPPIPPATGEPRLARDPDDSWANNTSAVPNPAAGAPVYVLSEGPRVTWNSQKTIRVKQDASLRFAVTDSAGEPVALEPYMGMFCHAAVLRRDGSIFAHLHPSGNFSMAAQTFFENKRADETGAAAGELPVSGEDHSMHHGHSSSAVSSVYLPYEFPEPGDYRIWVQFKSGGRVLTAVFDAHVES